MDTQIKHLFPENNPIVKYPLLVIHRPNPYAKWYEEDIVYMSMQQFKIFQEKHPDLTYTGIKKRNIRMHSEFGVIVSLPFSELVTKKVVV